MVSLSEFILPSQEKTSRFIRFTRMLKSVQMFLMDACDRLFTLMFKVIFLSYRFTCIKVLMKG